MKLHLALLTALCCNAGAHATAPSKKLSKKSNRSDKQRLAALKVDTTNISNESSEENDTDKTPFDLTVDPKHEEYMEPILERQPVEAQVMLGNVNIDDLTAEETMFFESSLRKAIEIAQDQEQGQQDEVTIGAILVENGHGTHKHDDRALRGGRLSFSKFNIWAVLETLRCRFCPPDDDDYSFERSGWTLITKPPTQAPVSTPPPFTYSGWYTYRSPWSNKTPWFTPPPTPSPTPAPTPKPEMDDDYITWYNNLLRSRNGDGRRHLGLSDSNTSLEEILCMLLREGPYERFHSVDKCALEVSAW